MKVNILYILLIIVLNNIYSCSKSDLMTFDGERLLIFSNPATNPTQSPIDSVVLDFAFATEDVKDTLITYPVKLIGKKLTTPTPFIVGVNKVLTTGVQNVDFKIDSLHIFPDDTVVYNLPIRIFRPSKERSKFKLKLELKTSESFKNDLFRSEGSLKESNSVVFHVTDELILPNNWSESGTSSGANFYLGPFSRKKLHLISKVVIAYTNSNNWTPAQVFRNVANSQNLQIFGQLLNNYLKEEAAKGNVVLDENGGLMIVGDYFK